MENLTHCKIVTPKNFNLKLCTCDYVGEITRHADFGVSICTVAAHTELFTLSLRLHHLLPELGKSLQY